MKGGELGMKHNAMLVSIDKGTKTRCTVTVSHADRTPFSAEETAGKRENTCPRVSAMNHRIIVSGPGRGVTGSARKRRTLKMTTMDAMLHRKGTDTGPSASDKNGHLFGSHTAGHYKRRRRGGQDSVEKKRGEIRRAERWSLRPLK
jgi:hypothetical protein